MKNRPKFIFALCLLMLCGSSVSAQQSSKPDEPHAGGGMPDMGKTGVIEGTVFSVNDKGQKTPVLGQEITMIIFNEGQQVLMLKKTTDEKGQYVFKNIFHDQAFAYGFGTMYEENLYVFPRLSLGPDEDSKKIDFQVGVGSPYLRDPATMGMKPDGGGNPAMGTPAASKDMSASGTDKHAHDNSFSRPYQFVAMGLGVVVLLIAAYFAGKKSAVDGYF